MEKVDQTEEQNLPTNLSLIEYIWLEIFLDSSECHFFGWIQTAPAPRLLYLCRKGKVSSNFWVDAMVWMSSNPKNIARKPVQEIAEIS